jgi:hypothetical protein
VIQQHLRFTHTHRWAPLMLETWPKSKSSYEYFPFYLIMNSIQTTYLKYLTIIWLVVVVVISVTNILLLLRCSRLGVDTRLRLSRSLNDNGHGPYIQKSQYGVGKKER